MTGELLRAAAVCGCLIAVILSLRLRYRYRDDIYKRLEESRTHKQMRELTREILAEKAARTQGVSLPRRVLAHFRLGAQSDARAHLDSGALPPLLTLIRQTVPITDTVGIVLLIIALRTGSVNMYLVSAVLSAAVLVLYLTYHITESVQAEREMPRMTRRARRSRSQTLSVLLGSWKAGDKPQYSTRERRVMIQVWLLRYSLLVPYIMLLGGLLGRSRTFAAAVGALILVYGSAFHLNYRRRTEVFWCAMQNIAHRRMTPFRHAPQEMKKSEKDGRWIGVLCIIMGAAIVTASIFIQE